MNDRRTSPPSVAIIGNDATLAAMPATPVQLAHACLAFGFDLAVPATWGDELVAAETLRRLTSPRVREPAIMCVCPHVVERLLSSGADLAPFLISVVAPPVAVARYLRAVYGSTPIRLTYIGDCPAATAPELDRRISPLEFFATLTARAIQLNDQPLVFDSVVPPDRRRWCSIPGGLPSAEMLWSDGGARTMIEVDAIDFSSELAQHLIARERALIDIAPRLGCACSGATGSMPSRAARGAVTALEPPRAPLPVVDTTIEISLDRPAVPPTRPIDSDMTIVGPAADQSARNETVVTPIASPTVDTRSPSAVQMPTSPLTPAKPTPAADESPRRRTPVATSMRHLSGGFPKTRSSEGRALPRAYVARRRGSSTPSGSSLAVTETPVEPAAVEPAAVEPAAIDATPVNETTVDETPVDTTAVDTTRVDANPVEPRPFEETPRDAAPAVDGAAVAEAPSTLATAEPSSSSAPPADEPGAAPPSAHAIPEPRRRSTRPIVYALLVLTVVALAIFVLTSAQSL